MNDSNENNTRARKESNGSDSSDKTNEMFDFFFVRNQTDCFSEEFETMSYSRYDIEHLDIPETVVPGAICQVPVPLYGIGMDTFRGHIELKSVRLPSSIWYVGTCAFKGCTNLETVSLREGIKSIEDGAFESCISLTEINLPSTIESIGSRAFTDCISLKRIVLPKHIRSIGQDAFTGCHDLVIEIAADAFTDIVTTKIGAKVARE